MPANLFQKYKLTRMSGQSEIREVFKRLARENHPDTRRSGGGNTREEFNQVNLELKVLMNMKERWNYDRFGKVGQEVDEMAEQVNRGLECIGGYLRWGLYIMFIMPNDVFLNTKMNSLILSLTFLLFDIYNISARRVSTFDPFDYIYFDLTILERSQLVSNWFYAYIFLLITYSHAFTVSWLTKFNTVYQYSRKVLVSMQSQDHVDNREEWLKQEKIITDYCEDIKSALNVQGKPKEQKQTVLEEETPSPVQETRAAEEPQNELKERDTAQNPYLEKGAQEKPVPGKTVWGLIWSIVKPILFVYLSNTVIQFVLSL